MGPIAKFEKVSKDQFLEDCWVASGNKEAYGESLKDVLLHCPSVEEIINNFIEPCIRVWDNIKLPKRATKGSAGYDFYIPDNTTLNDKWYQLIPTGIRCKIDPGYVLMLYPRSGLGFKHAFGLANTTGIIDSDYYYSDNEGHIIVKASACNLTLNAGDRFVQGIFLPYYLAEEDEIKTERSGGFGSTGA